MIPKIIWQTHNYEYEDLPFPFNKNSKTWQLLNLNWEYKYVSKEERDDFVKSELPEIYQSYMNMNKEMYKADVWRYIALYKNGGVYADMDSICVEPLDYMLENYNGEDLIPTKPWNNWPQWDHGLINNANFAAVKNSTTLKNILNFLVKNHNTVFEHLTWPIFSKEAKKINGIKFTAAFHGQELKKDFYNYDIDYYGEIIKYSHFLETKSGLSQEDIKKYGPDLNMSFPDHLPKYLEENRTARNKFAPTDRSIKPHIHTNMNDAFNM